MSALFPVLTRAARFGVVFGTGLELFAGNRDGVLFAIGVVASIAFGALRFYFGGGVAAGVLVGTFYAILTGPRIEKVIGSGLLGGSLGYLWELVMPQIVLLPFLVV